VECAILVIRVKNPVNVRCFVLICAASHVMAAKDATRAIKNANEHAVTQFVPASVAIR
jgi:hypothetical protein